MPGDPFWEEILPDVQPKPGGCSVTETDVLCHTALTERVSEGSDRS